MSYRTAKKSYLDLVDLFCQFYEGMELAANEPDLEFIKTRIDFLTEEVKEHIEGVENNDIVEIIDGAADVVFVALGQIYHAFRMKGFAHSQAQVHTRTSLIFVGMANLTKEKPTKKGEKIKKPKDFISPNEDIKWLTETKKVKSFA